MEESQNPTVNAAAATAAEDDWSGRVLGEFTIVRLLGSGGMGQVFLAEQQSLKRKVAIKVLRVGLAANDKARLRFRAEAQAVAALTHPNIVQVYAIDEFQGQPYMALEYVEGRNLRDFLNRKGPPDLPVALAIMKQVGVALQKAGELNFVHRDIKPENILLSVTKLKDKDGKTATRLSAVKVTDFGLSRCLSESDQPLNLTQSGVAMGTPLYMSPEQVQGKPVDQRSDMYSFGITCYHLLAGQPPFRGASAFDVALKHVQNEPPPLSDFRPDLPNDLCALVHKMMAKKPEDRYQSAKEFLRDLSGVRGSLGMAAPMPTSATGSVDEADEIPTVTEAISAEMSAYRSARDFLPLSRPVLIGTLVSLLMAMVLGGVFLRFLTNRISQIGHETGPKQVVELPVVPVVSADERFALDAAGKFADPKSLDEIRRGLNFQIDLTLYYFKQHRFDDAERFLIELRDRNYRPAQGFAEHPYVGFAKLGLGLLAAFRDDSKKSMDILVKAVPPNQPPGGAFRLTGFPQAPIMIDHFELRRVVAEALNRNAKNMHIEKFAVPYSSLETLRKPPELGKPIRPFSKPSDTK